MSVSGGPDIIEEGLLLWVDVKNSKCIQDQNNFSDMTGTADFYREFQSGTTTVDGITYDRIDLGFVNDNGVIEYNPKPPETDTSDYYNEGGNWYRSNFAKVWGKEDFTWIVWCKPNQPSYGVLIDWKYTGRNSFYSINGNKLRITYRQAVEPYDYFTSESDVDLIEYGKWNFCAVRRSGTNVKFFNGIKSSSELFYDVDWKEANGIGIGWGPDSDRDWRVINANIGPILIYNRALNDSEIQQIYNSQKSRFNL